VEVCGVVLLFFENRMPRFMDEWYQEHRVYAASLIQSLLRRVDLMRCLNEKINENYEKYIHIINALDSEVQAEINEWQEDQELPT
jgi:hypothetical protein